MGNKQDVNQTSGPSCQGTAVLHAKVPKYETAEMGQAGRKKGLCFIGKAEATEEDPLKTCHSLVLSLPHLFLSCSTNLALGLEVLSNLWFHLEQ